MVLAGPLFSEAMALKHDGVRSNYDRDEGALPLPLRERVGVRGSGLSREHNPSPGSHLRGHVAKLLLRRRFKRTAAVGGYASPARGKVNRARL